LVYEEFSTLSSPAEISVQVLRFVARSLWIWICAQASCATIDGVMAVARLSEFESLLASDHHRPAWTLRPSLESCPFPCPRSFAFRRFCSLTALDDLQAVSQASHSNRTCGDDLRDWAHFMDRQSDLSSLDGVRDGFV
jgi:hypothetical protein